MNPAIDALNSSRAAAPMTQAPTATAADPAAEMGKCMSDMDAKLDMIISLLKPDSSLESDAKEESDNGNSDA